MEKQKIEEKWVDTDNGKIFYYQNRPFPGRPTLIFLHGLSSNHTTWNFFSLIAEQHNLNFLALDLRGHGFSDKTKKRKLYRWRIFSNDLEKILKQEQVNDFILIGYSFGGHVALDYIIRHPKSARGLVLITTSYANPLEYKHLKFLTPVFSGALILLAYLLLWQKRKRYHYYQHGKAVGYWDSVVDGLKTMPLSVNFWLLANEFKVNFKKEIGQIKIPTMIIRGQKDAFITKAEIDDMAKLISKSEVVVSKNPSHFVGTNSQQEITQMILSFLKRAYENSNF